jgi:hypothetical protein
LSSKDFLTAPAPQTNAHSNSPYAGQTWHRSQTTALQQSVPKKSPEQVETVLKGNVVWG